LQKALASQEVWVAKTPAWVADVALKYELILQLLRTGAIVAVAFGAVVQPVVVQP